MKNHVLCSIDFSESSARSLEWAHKLAVGTDAHLSVLYSYRLIQTGKVADILQFKRTTEEESRQKFTAMTAHFDPGYSHKTSFFTEIGFYSDAIENFIRKNPSTLVVLSESLAESIYDHKGQTLQNFIKSIKVPLLVVPFVSEAAAQGEKKSFEGKAVA